MSAGEISATFGPRMLALGLLAFVPLMSLRSMRPPLGRWSSKAPQPRRPHHRSGAHRAPHHPGWRPTSRWTASPLSTPHLNTMTGPPCCLIGVGLRAARPLTTRAAGLSPFASFGMLAALTTRGSRPTLAACAVLSMLSMLTTPLVSLLPTVGMLRVLTACLMSAMFASLVFASLLSECQHHKPRQTAQAGAEVTQ